MYKFIKYSFTLVLLLVTFTRCNDSNSSDDKSKEQGEKFLADNKSKEGIKVTESGLQYKVLTEGNGEKPNSTSTVEVLYKGSFINGDTFDSSKEPISFALNQVIRGWTEGIQLMSVGSKYEFYIPYHLAYGASGNRGIPGYSMLIFEVELLEVK